LGPRSAAFHAGLYCSPCLNAANSKIAPCGGRNLCMSLVPQEDVLEGALALLDGGEIRRASLEKWRGYEGRWSHDDWKSVGGGVP
ncbi:MAG TPA: hypothetical protein VEN81_17775, partial [Planctomycetota bacterium]|nr:hypothetical protein [Planctomycetota bacterium]